MSKLKKRVILICVVLAVMMTCIVGMLVFAADVVPMPTGNKRGLARMRRDIYDMYMAGTISKDDFDRYATAFELNTQVAVELGDSRYGNTVKIEKEKDSKGSSKTAVKISGNGMMNVRLYGSAAYNEEMVKNFDLRQKFFAINPSASMGTSYDSSDVMYAYGSISGEYESLLKASKLYGGGIKNGHYTWNVYTRGQVTVKDFSYQLLDKGNAGVDDWTFELEESGENAADGKTIYQLLVRDNNGDQFRPANRQITYEDLETLQLEVYMKSIATNSNGKTYTIPAKAVGIRDKVTSDQGYPSAIVFEFYGDEWLNMEDAQVVITGVKPVQVKPESGKAAVYDVWDMYSNLDLTEKFGVTSSTPVTDFAGNEICWEGTTITKKGPVGMDRKEAVVVDVELDFIDMFSTNSSGSGENEAAYAESFIGTGDYVFWPTLVMNEEMFHAEEAKGKVAIQFNLRDKNGNPVTSTLERYYNYTNRNGIVYTELVFGNVVIDKDMTPQGEQIVIEKILNEELLRDRVGNNNIANDIIMTGDPETSVWPNQVRFLDTVSPEVSLQDTVVRQKTTTDGKVESIQITVPFKVTDYTPKNEQGENLMASTASGTTAWVRLSNPVNGQKIEYKYTITHTTDFPGTDADWNTGNLGRTGHSNYGTFGVADEKQNIYLHMELSNLADYEISERDGLEMTLHVQDMAANEVKVERNIPINGVDNVGPDANLYGRSITVVPGATAVTFGTYLDVTDTNGIHLVEYRFADSEDDAETAYNVIYQKPADAAYELNLMEEISQTFDAAEQVEKVLQVRVYDKNNNESLVSMPFAADLNKVISSYELKEDIFLPSDQSGIEVSAPIFGGELLDTASTRITVAVPAENQTSFDDYDVYFRVIPAGALTNPVQALDPNSGDWYQAAEMVYHDQNQYYIYRGVTKVDGKPGWVDHYGEMDVYIASSNLEMDLVTEDGILVLEPGFSMGDETDTTYSWSKIGTVSHAADLDGVYTMSYDTSDTRILLTDSTGTEIPALIRWDPADSSKELYRYAKFNQNISGVRVNVSLNNEQVSQWGADGIDFENSYAVLVRADENGTIVKDDAGNYDEVTERVFLSNSLKQTLTVPDTAAEGESFTSGVYTWVVHIAQKGGGVSDFATGEVYLILDNANVPVNFGVLEHTTKIQVVDGYPGRGHQYITDTKTPQTADDTLRVVNIGIAKPTAMMTEEYDASDDSTTYIFQEKLEEVQIDGITAYLRGVANGSEFGSSYQNEQLGKFTITADMRNSGYGTFLGEEVGTVQGIRFWNKANVDDPAEVDYIMQDMPYRDSTVRAVNAEFSQEDGVAKLDVSFNVAWYMPGDTPLYESAEALKAALPNGKFGVINGENTICYQLLMDNGKESAIYQFTLNLVEEVPSVNVDFDFGPYYHHEVTGARHTENAKLIFSDMFSEYSGLKVYHVEYQDGKSDGDDYYAIHQLTDKEITDGYLIEEGCTGYNSNYSYDLDNFGYSGTSITGQLECTGSESFFVILDNSGNAVTVYPMDSESESNEGYSEVVYEKKQVFEKFMPEKLEMMAGEDGFIDGMYIAQLIGEGGSDSNLYMHDQVEVRIDPERAATEEEKTELWAGYNPDEDVLDVPNKSGFAAAEPSYSGTLGVVAPYDPAKAEGEMATHTLEVRVKGVTGSNGQPNYAETFTTTFDAPNTKPVVTNVEAKAGCILVTHNMPVYTDNGASNVAVVSIDESVYGTQGYTYSFRDVYGNVWEEQIDVPEKPADPVVTYSTKEFTEDAVSVTITSANDLTVISDADWTAFKEDYNLGLYYDEANDAYFDLNVELYCTFELDEEGDIPWDDEGNRILTYYLDPQLKIKVEGVRTNKLVLTSDANFDADVYYYINDWTEEYAAYVNVENIVKTAAVDPYISWDYNAGDVVDGVVYGDVTAYLVDANGQALLDPATGKPAEFTFYPDGPTEYTFTGCYSEATKTAVPDVVAKLEVELQPEPITEKDTFAPDVDIVAYLTNQTGSKPANMVYRKSTDRFLMNNYAFQYGLPEDEVYFEDINEMILGMGWSESYMFHLDIHDESRVKVILKADLMEENVNFNSASDELEGVTLVGRTLQVTQNCEFALYIIDEENNITALAVNVANLVGAPVPELTQVESRTEDGGPAVRVYLLPPQIQNYENLMITNVGKVTDLEEFDGVTSEYFGLDYMIYDESGSYDIYYSYEVPGMGTYTGELKAEVSVPELVIPAVVNPVWSANYFNKLTNQEITLHLDLNTPVKSVSVVYTVGENDNLVAEQMLKDAGLYINAFAEDISIYYENNTDALLQALADQFGEGKLRLMMAQLEYGAIGYYDLPEIKSIDRTAPALAEDVKIEYPENDSGLKDYKSAVITLNLNETALSGDGRQKGTEFAYTVRENKVYSYDFVDEAGNRSSIEVEITDLITEPLKITLSTSASDAGIIEDPATFRAEVGQTLYAKTNRDATIYIYGESTENTTMVGKDSWTAITVTENSMGLHPSVVARDNFGNLTIVQLEYIPIKDITAPAAFVHRDTISVAATATEAQIHAALMDNILYSDDTTAMGDLVVSIDYDRIESGRTVVTYTITDEEGNQTIRQCYLRIRSGLEPVIHVNGELVEDGAFLYVTDTNDLNMTVEYDAEIAEPYKLVYEEGDLRSWAKLKDGNWLTAGYEDKASQSYEIADLGDGWYSFALTTQGMEVYYFQVHIGQTGR